MNQIQSRIQMADLVLEFYMNEDNRIFWVSTDLFSDSNMGCAVKEGDEPLFWQAVHIALSGEDDVDNYKEIERALGFIGYNGVCRWIP